MSLLASQYVVLNYEDFEFISDEIIETSDVTLDQLSVSFWADFFKTAFNVASNADIPGLCALANMLFSPTSKFSRDYTLVHSYGHVTVSIRFK